MSLKPPTEGTPSTATFESRISSVESGVVYFRASGGDDAAALTTALDAADKVILTESIQLASLVDVPTNTDIEGRGMRQVVVTCTAAGAGLRFGTRASQGRGGESGGFKIDGGSVATQPLRISSVQRSYINVEVVNSAGDGFYLDGAQNNAFVGCNAEDCADTCWAIDNGAGGNTFLRCEGDRATKYIVDFRQTVDTSGSALYYAEPQHNLFIGGTLERFGTTVGGGTVGTGLAIVHYGAGQDNWFIGCGLAGDNDTAGRPVVITELLGSYATAAQRLVFEDCVLSGSVTLSTAIEMRGNTSVTLGGRTVLRGFLRAFYMKDTDVINDDTVGNPFSSVTTKFVTNGGTSNADTLVRKRIVAPVEVTRDASTDNAVVIKVSGEAGTRTFIRPGALYMGSGGSNSIANFAEMYHTTISGANALRMDHLLVLTAALQHGTAGPKDFAGTGSPEGAQTAPVGSTWRRTDGGAGTSFYVKESGSGNTGWVAK